MQRGFTLIEVMVVIVILGVLAALIVPRVLGRPDEARVVAAKQDIGAIMQALKLYKLDNRRYPSAEQGCRRWSEAHHAAGPRELEGLPRETAQRSLGQPYQYLNPGIQGEVDVFSYGADNASGGEGVDADIGSWNL